MGRATLLAIVALIVASPAQAQNLGAFFGRIDELAQFVPDSVVCKRLGYDIDEEKLRNMDQAVRAEAAQAGVDPDQAMTAVIQRMRSNTDRSMAELHAVATKYQRDAAKLQPTLTATLDRVGARCAVATKDKLLGTIITAPSPAAGAAARTELLDQFLADAGQASWQTPTVVARGDLMFALGACRRDIDADTLKRLTDGYIVSGGQGTREQLYYSRWFETGIEHASELDLDKAQCDRLIAGRAKKPAPIAPKKAR